MVNLYQGRTNNKRQIPKPKTQNSNRHRKIPRAGAWQSHRYNLEFGSNINNYPFSAKCLSIQIS